MCRSRKGGVEASKPKAKTEKRPRRNHDHTPIAYGPSPKNGCLAEEPPPPHPPPSNSTSNCVTNSNCVTDSVSVSTRPRDELLKGVLAAPTIEDALEIIMAAAPLEPVLSSAKRRRVVVQDGAPVGHVTQPAPAAASINTKSCHRLLAQSVRAASSVEDAMDILMAASRAEKFRRKKLRTPCQAAPPLVVERRVDPNSLRGAQAADSFQVPGKQYSSAHVLAVEALASHQFSKINPGEPLGIPQGKPPCTSARAATRFDHLRFSRKRRFGQGLRSRMQLSRACASASGSLVLALRKVA